MQALKRKEENGISGVVKKLLLFSFFCFSFSIIVFAIVAAVAVKLVRIENSFDIIATLTICFVALDVSFFMFRKNDKPFFDAVVCGTFFDFVLLAVSLICGSRSAVESIILRLALVPAASIIGVLLSKIKAGKVKKKRMGKGRVNVSRKKY